MLRRRRTGLLARSMTIAALAACATRPSTATDPHARIEENPAVSPIPPQPPPAAEGPRGLESSPTREPEADAPFSSKEITLASAPVERKLWVYLPVRKSHQKRPLVLVAPAGSSMMWGMGLGDGDRPEHLPYAAAGFAVVAYSLDGALPSRTPTDQEVIEGVKGFQEAKAGVVNASAALDWALANLSEVAPNRVYAAGHSSAATLALLFATQDHRVRAVAAYAPAPYPTHWLATPPRTRLVEGVRRFVPGLGAFLAWSEPGAHTRELNVPVFVFQSEEDGNVQMADTVKFVADLGKTNSHVTFVRAEHGDHYGSMIHEGLPRGVEWLARL
jgi:dipeptidyl aminopeptidase/acylaminoacyl peptidase